MHHRLLVGEVAPDPITVSLVILTAYLVAWGLIQIAKHLTEALFGIIGMIVGKIPFVGGALEGATRTAEQWIASKISVAVAAVDHQIANNFHRLAGITRWVAHELAAHADALLAIANVLRSPLSIPGWAALWSHFSGFIDSIPGRIAGEVTKTTRPIVARVGRISAAVLAALAALRTSLTHVIEHDIGSLRARTKALEKEYTNLFKQMKALTARFGAVAFAGAVAIALARLGLSWVRCSNVGKVGKQICRSPANLLDDLLTLITDFAVLSNICQVIPWLERGFADIAAPFIETFSAASAKFCSPRSQWAAPLDVPQLHLTSNPSDALHLP